MDAILETYRWRGSVIVEYALDDDDLARLDMAFDQPAAGARRDAVPAVLLDWIGAHPVLTRLATTLAGGDRPARLVRAIAIDKSPEANWFVPWHQDRTIAVRANADAPKFETCTQKDGIDHVEPPVAILERMVTLRIHLDDCGEENGPLEVIPGSHRHGRLDKAAIAVLLEGAVGTLCLAVRGDILAMSPLTVHRSQRARRPRRCRILHLDWAACDLTAPLVFHLS